MKPHSLEREHGRPAVEHANDDLLAVRRRERRDAQVDGDAVDRDARAPILRPQPIGDVEPRENLDARHERRPDGARQRSRQREHAVDAMANGDALLFRLDVNVARARRDAGGEQLVDEIRDRRAAVSSPGDRRRAPRDSLVRCWTSSSRFGLARPRPRRDTPRRSARAISSAVASASRTWRPVAKPSVRSQSTSSGSAVAISSSCSVADSGTM